MLIVKHSIILLLLRTTHLRCTAKHRQSPDSELSSWWIYQVGDPDIDHKCWERPETTAEKRPTIQVNTTHPGSDVAAETAAAMAAASLVFKNQDPHYSKLLLDHAQKLFNFANSYPGVYTKSIPSIQDYYNSSGFVDELLWAAAWLYHATQDRYYISYVTVLHGNMFANWGNPTWFSWDNKLAGTQVSFAFHG